MSERDFTSKNLDISNSIEITNSTIKQENMKTFTERKKVIQDIISKIISTEKFTVNINLKDVNIEEEYIERFIIELRPRLKEIGASVTVTNNNILNSKFLEQNEL